jgi:hypothetical protein
MRAPISVFTSWEIGVRSRAKHGILQVSYKRSIARREAGRGQSRLAAEAAVDRRGLVERPGACNWCNRNAPDMYRLSVRGNYVLAGLRLGGRRSRLCAHQLRGSVPAPPSGQPSPGARGDGGSSCGWRNIWQAASTGDGQPSSWRATPSMVGPRAQPRIAAVSSSTSAL